MIYIRLLTLTAALTALITVISFALPQSPTPGSQLPATSEASEHKLGSVLVYNYYSASASNPVAENTDISLTNTNVNNAVTVHVFFVNANNGRAGDVFLVLGPQRTISLLASNYDPGGNGYVIAVAVDGATGCPINFNHLTGDAYIKLAGGYRAALGAIAFSAIAASPASCGNGAAILNFDGANYNRGAATLATENFAALADGNNHLLIINRLGGNLTASGSAGTIGAIYGTVFDDARNSSGFTDFLGFQSVKILNDDFPSIVPRLGTFIPAGRSGWLKLSSSNNYALSGALLRYNPNDVNASNAFTGGSNLTHLALAPIAALTIPVRAPNTAPDLSISKTHQGNFTREAVGEYTINVTNVGMIPTTLPTVVTDQLPGALTLDGYSGLGWECTGIATANVQCSNRNLINANGSLPMLRLQARIGAGTPIGTNSIINRAIVANGADSNTANNAADDPTTVDTRVVTATALASAANPATTGQSITFTANVSASSGTPSGTVEFAELTANGTLVLVGTASLVNGSAQLTTTVLTTGVHTLRATYLGNTSFARSFSAPLMQTVTPGGERAATTTTLTATPNSSRFGQAVTLMATVNSTAGTPMGTVDFRDGATIIGSGTLMNSVAVITTSALNVGSHTLTAVYLGDANFNGSQSSALTQTVTAPIDPGLPLTQAMALSDQAPGSVLFYNYYTSTVEMSVTNTNTSSGVVVRLFLVKGATGVVANFFIKLGPNQTATVPAAMLNPDRGHAVAVAVDGVSGCPIKFNHLIGAVLFKQSTGHAADLNAIAFAALSSAPIACDSGRATLNFDGVSYPPAPRALELTNIPARADGNDSFLILNRFGGDLTPNGTPAMLGEMSGQAGDDAENILTFQFSGGTQFTSSLSNFFPRTTPRFETFIPAGRSGRMKLYQQSEDGAIMGAALNFNPNAATSADAFNGGENLHALTTTISGRYVIPATPPPPPADLAITKTHNGNFTVGATGVYTINVDNAAEVMPALGVITVTDTLPSNLTLAAFSGAGWTCTGLGSNNVVCRNCDGLMPGTSLAPLALTVNIGSGTTPGVVTNTATVAIAPTQETNLNNNTVNDPTTINCLPISIDPNALPNATASAAYSRVFTATGGQAPYNFLVTGGQLPMGLALAANGTLSGTPTVTGSFILTVRATDINGCAGEQQYQLAVNCQAITVNPGTLETGTVGAAYPLTNFSAASAIGAVSFGLSGALPNGMNFANGMLSGTPTQSGNFPITITATDANQCTSSRSYTLVIQNCPLLTINPATLPNGAIEVAYQAITFTGTGGATPYNFTISGALPSGLTLANGTLSGTPTQGGAFNLTVTTTDRNGCTGQRSYSLFINRPPAIALSGELMASINSPFSFTPSVSDADAPPQSLTYRLSGAPTGATINPTTGFFSWTPTAQQVGLHTFTITVSDNGSPSLSASQSFTIRVRGRAVTLTLTFAFVQTEFGPVLVARARLTDALTGALLAGRPLKFTIVSAQSAAMVIKTTNGNGEAEAGIRRDGNNQTVTVMFAGDELYETASTTATYSGN
jgi:uncharacterized repeat protein (TIGR01451 family)